MAANSHDARRRTVNTGAERATVLFVNTPTRAPLGADTWVHVMIMRWLDRRAYDVHAACQTGSEASPTPTYRLLRDVADLHVKPVDFGRELSRSSTGALVRSALSSARAPFSFLDLARYARRHHVRIIHTSDRPRDAVACVALARLTGAACIIHVHVGFGTWMSRGLRWALGRADALIAVSHFVAGTLVDAGYDAQRIHVVHNAIDVDRWTPGDHRSEVRAELDIDGDDPVVLTVCRLFPSKGPVELMKACAELRQTRAGLRLVVVGTDVTGGAFQRELEVLARELAMTDSVVFAGQRDDIPALMAAADVFAMPSFGEPFGLVYLEAMAMEVPVVGLDNGGTPEVVDDGRTGLLVPAGDIAALAATIGRLLDEPALARRLGRLGRERVLRSFTPAAMAAGVARVYQGLLGGRKDDRQERVMVGRTM